MSELFRFQETNTITSPALELGQIHLWWLSLAIDADLQQAFIAELNSYQLEKYNRIEGQSRQQQYVAGRGYLNRLLRHYVGSKSSIELVLGEHGKPALLHNPEQLHFNFTDTCGYGLFAFALSSDLGVDLEYAERKANFSRIVERRFAPDEQYLCHQSRLDFLRCWTRKEAYGKAIGKGLNYPLREYSMCNDLSKREFSISEEGFFGQQFMINTDQREFVACVVSQGLAAKEIQAFHLV